MSSDGEVPIVERMTGDAAIVERMTDAVEIVERMTGALLRRFSDEPYSLLPHILSYPLHLVGAALMNPRRALIQARTG